MVSKMSALGGSINRRTWCATAAVLVVIMTVAFSGFQVMTEHTSLYSATRVLSSDTVVDEAIQSAILSASAQMKATADFKTDYDFPEVSIKVTNEYTTAQQKIFDYPFLKDAYLLEPYRESTISVSGLSADCGVEWRLDPPGGAPQGAAAAGFSGTADKILIVPKLTGKYVLTLQQSCSGSFAQFTVWLKYVRRELSTLTDADREEFLDAMHVLWTTSTEEGKQLYGDKYKSINYLTAIHSDAGANGYCDQFHGNSGFLNSHVYLGAYMEQSLQLVNPRVALHYMEYTKYFKTDAFTHAHIRNQLDGGKWSKFFTDEWFGSSDPYSGRITNSRWADLQAPFLDNTFFAKEGIDKNEIFFPENADTWFDFTQYAHVYSPYGYLRSPWNFNPDKYYTRYHNVDRLNDTSALPGALFSTYNGIQCSEVGDYLQSIIGQSLEQVMMTLEVDPHNAAHFTIAGVGGDIQAQNDQILREQFGFTDNEILWTTYMMQVFRKTEYSSHHSNAKLQYSDIPYDYELGAYTVDKVVPPNQDGGVKVQVSPAFLTTKEKMDEFIAAVFNDDHYGPEGRALDTASQRLYAVEDDAKRIALQLLAERFQFDGELATSTAPLDPVFWVLHGTLERLYQRIVFEGVLSDMSWTTERSCAGHNPGSTKYWLKGFFLQDPSIEVEQLTNVQLLNILDPTGDDFATLLNFVYDSSSWEWCDGFDDFFTARE